jgi:hypothetical protein
VKCEFASSCNNCDNEPILSKWANDYNLTEVQVRATRADLVVRGGGSVNCEGLLVRHDGRVWCQAKVTEPDLSLLVEPHTPVALEIPVPIECPKLVGKTILGSPYGLYLRKEEQSLVGNEEAIPEVSMAHTNEPGDPNWTGPGAMLA